ncbi:MAG: type II toxin-antitoxin system prevent-host-death family antitoxin [Candidatus Dormibacteraeota bacterium]|nr:type II toxin-antitoxin system prevent-host-death family antitoxin [Candidatus Dormibacteraeota bacterium]
MVAGLNGGSGLPRLCYIVGTVSNIVGIRELRQQTSSVLRRVRDGETIDVTDHGHPIARVVPLRPGAIDQLMLEGRVSEPEGDLLDLMQELGLPAPPGRDRVLPSESLTQLRRDER